ncbi:5,10-methylene tetrahydromethanopterin reductase [Kribbella sp. ALI-6-A]|uniref:LLM class flavin-dependent oxidoreductase n=2 Tax=Kribbella sp. ALI-6-A TaxID=1933817 RepID=UPI00097BDFE7|nr:LLM class flavin-dependent oxidoreductase [Kribbella sp. ALI-6-A]ONI78545.1 5,10-methylene tetrahydromethanopterin reductase [Kribbella sp. ALI-6-A]
MSDYGHELSFGSFVSPTAAQPRTVLELAQLTEQLDLDLFTVQDHPYQAGFLDAWTLLSVVAAQTTRLRVMPNVVNLPLRSPAVLAKSAASLDLLTNGRVELGLGAGGGFWDAIAAMGGPRRTPGEAVEALDEAIRIMRGMWNPNLDAVRVDGRHYRVHGTHPGPAPAHDISIVIGAIKPRMLRLTGRLADGWLPSSPIVVPAQLRESNELIDEAAVDAGRKPSDIRRMYNLVGRFSSDGSGFLAGPPTVWAQQIAELAINHGMSAFIAAGDDPEFLTRFAREVVPAVREIVEEERKAPPPTGGGARASVTHSSADKAAPSSRPGRFLPVPTPDDGQRVSNRRVWDESTRPSGPVRDPARSYTPKENATGQHLIDMHNDLRNELTELQALVNQIAQGKLGPSQARSQINAMTMRQNNWTLGTYCESYCRVLTMHHTIEDASMFPDLERGDPRLRPVIDRLKEEHLVVHDLLEELDRALVALVSEPDGLEQVRAALDVLSDALLSHLAYEERELIEPLARLT